MYFLNILTDEQQDERHHDTRRATRLAILSRPDSDDINQLSVNSCSECCSKIYVETCDLNERERVSVADSINWYKQVSEKVCLCRRLGAVFDLSFVRPCVHDHKR